MEKYGTANGYLIDGFPRQMDQALQFEASIGQCALVLYYECGEKSLLKRLLLRGETSGRNDDNISSITKRFHTYLNVSYPVIEYFAQIGKLHRINSEASIDTVYSQSRDIILQYEQGELNMRQKLHDPAQTDIKRETGNFLEKDLISLETLHVKEANTHFEVNLKDNEPLSGLNSVVDAKLIQPTAQIRQQTQDKYTSEQDFGIKIDGNVNSKNTIKLNNDDEKPIQNATFDSKENLKTIVETSFEKLSDNDEKATHIASDSEYTYIQPTLEEMPSEEYISPAFINEGITLVREVQEKIIVFVLGGPGSGKGTMTM